MTQQSTDVSRERLSDHRLTVASRVSLNRRSLATLKGDRVNARLQLTLLSDRQPTIHEHRRNPSKLVALT